jgi:flagellar hook-length control protein FliK
VTDSAQQPIASLLRSVVVDVAQPDLGHVNIRVAMMNDSVHAHFSTDRAEVGQFLINGQDRLQTTLQASGLDMGQFRVDIDRQNGGRSFQQGLFQEQGQSGQHGTQGFAKEQAQEWPDDTRALLQGRLNVVA